jgi:VWFA-related protein
MSCTIRPSRLVLILLTAGFALTSPAQRGSPPPARTGGTVQSPVPDFSRLPDLSNAPGVRFQSYDKTPLTFTSKPTYVLVPVVVTDKDGKPVSALKKEDFHVQENGKDQIVASLEEIKPNAAPLSGPAAPRNEVTNQASRDATPRRLIIIALDMVNTPFEDQARARPSMIAYLSQNIQPDNLYELVAIENNGLRILHDYTQDTATLIATLKAVGGKFPTVNENAGVIQRAGNTDPGATANPRVAVVPESGDPIFGPPQPGGGPPPFAQVIASFLAASEMARVQASQANAASSTLTALQQIAQRSSGIPGRKSLIWITGSFPFSIDPGSASVSEGTAFAIYQHTMQLLESQLISVYPVDARGLVTAQFDATTQISARQLRAGAAGMLSDQSNRLLDTLNTMRAFADMTGGHAYLNTNDTTGAIRDAAQDGSDYYLLSYSVDKSDRRPGWRKITVKVGDCHVRARHGYFLTQTTMDPKVTAAYDIDNALKSPFDYTGLPLRVTLPPPVSQGDKRKVTFAMTMPPKAASVDNSDNNHLHVDIAYAVWSATGQDAAHKGTSYNLNLNPSQLEMIETMGLGYGDSFELFPGAYRLRVVVRDNLTGQIGSVQAPLELK